MDRVRENTPEQQNVEIDSKLVQTIEHYANISDKNLITERIQQLDREWDIERALETNMPLVALPGIVLGAFVSRKWLVLPAVVLGFFLQHAIQGWCPPLPIFRKLGYRTRKEIDKEKYALKFLRGDFTLADERMRQDPERLVTAVNA